MASPLQARRGWFYVGGHYERAQQVAQNFSNPIYGDGLEADGQVMTGQMYVSFAVPDSVIAPYPIVMIHGGGQTGTNFEGTPDGREGWADFFIALGYATYVVDQPVRGRSSIGRAPRKWIQLLAEYTERNHTAPAAYQAWPQAALHTQWPGTGRIGDPAFQQFHASQVPFEENGPDVAAVNRDAGIALLERIGPAVLVTHSQSGEHGWLIADARPELVKAVVALEPVGPPVYAIERGGPADKRRDLALERPWGITSVPITYAPPVNDASELRFERQASADGPDLVRGWLQQEPARQLVKLKRIPILLLTGEASYHAAYDHCTSNYLKQAGVEHDFVRLADVGIHGNGHMMMLEKNNLDIACFIHDWLRRHHAG